MPPQSGFSSFERGVKRFPNGMQNPISSASMHSAPSTSGLPTMGDSHQLGYLARQLVPEADMAAAM